MVCCCSLARATSHHVKSFDTTPPHHWTEGYKATPPCQENTARQNGLTSRGVLWGDFGGHLMGSVWKGRLHQRRVEHLLLFPGIQGIALVPRVGKLDEGTGSGRRSSILP